MIFGREYWRYPRPFLNILTKEGISHRTSPKLEALLKAYIMLWGIPNPSFQLRAAYFQRFTKRLHFSYALDAGCGIGLQSMLLAKRYPNARIDAYDTDSDSIAVAKDVAKELRLDNLHFVEQDLLQLSNISDYDFIFCIDVLEHVKEDEQLIKIFSKTLKKGGVLYVATPHERHVKRLLHRFGLQYDSKEHVREGYSEAKLKSLLCKNGFTVNQIKNTWGLVGWGCEELYMLSLLRLPLVCTGLICPLLTVTSRLDMYLSNSKGGGLIAVGHKD
jgi:ubiquinone/menaquinone biosynthesis C-methylase UbiE